MKYNRLLLGYWRLPAGLRGRQIPQLPGGLRLVAQRAGPPSVRQAVLLPGQRAVPGHAAAGLLARRAADPARKPGQAASPASPACFDRAMNLDLLPALSHPELKDVYQWILITMDAHGLYQKFGFEPLKNPERWMAILKPRPDRPHFVDA